MLFICSNKVFKKIATHTHTRKGLGLERKSENEMYSYLLIRWIPSLNGSSLRPSRLTPSVWSVSVWKVDHRRPVAFRSRFVWTPHCLLKSVFWLPCKRAGVLLEWLESERARWSALSETWQSLRRTHICAAEMHPFILVRLEPFPPLSLVLSALGANLSPFAWLLCRWYNNLDSIVWAYVEWLGGVQVYLSFPARFTFFPLLPCSLPAPSSFAAFSIFLHYLRDNCCDAHTAWRRPGWQINSQPNAACRVFWLGAICLLDNSKQCVIVLQGKLFCCSK